MPMFHATIPVLILPILAAAPTLCSELAAATVKMEASTYAPCATLGAQTPRPAPPGACGATARHDAHTPVLA